MELHCLSADRHEVSLDVCSSFVFWKPLGSDRRRQQEAEEGAMKRGQLGLSSGNTDCEAAQQLYLKGGVKVSTAAAGRLEADDYLRKT